MDVGLRGKKTKINIKMTLVRILRKIRSKSVSTRLN